MKFIKWKILIVTSIVCLLPMILGLVLWNELPEVMAIHFDINNNPDNFARKGVVVFGLPFLMVLLQDFCCIVNDINVKKHKVSIKIERVTKWIIPIMTIVLEVLTFGYALGWGIDIRKTAALLVGLILIVTGNYLPKLDYVKNYDLDTEKARKINRFVGFETVIIGVLFILSMFFPPVATVICLVLLILSLIIGVIYGVKVSRKK